MKPTAVLLLSVFFVLAGSSAVFAQLTAASEGPIVYGHHHFNVTSVEEHKRFWVDTLGGTHASAGPLELFRFPNVFIATTERAPTGGTKGTTVNHLGFSMPNVRAMLDKVAAAGYPIVTREELPPALAVENQMAHIADQDTYIAFVMGPDDIKVELFENRSQTEPIALHHVHFAVPAQDIDAMQAWYAKVFGADPGMRGSFKDADLPGVNLTFQSSAESGGWDAGTKPGSHRVRGRQSRSVLQEAGGGWDNVRSAVHGDRGDRPFHRIHHRPVRHLYRAHGRVGRRLALPWRAGARRVGRGFSRGERMGRGGWCGGASTTRRLASGF